LYENKFEIAKRRQESGCGLVVRNAKLVWRVGKMSSSRAISDGQIVSMVWGNICKLPETLITRDGDNN